MVTDETVSFNVEKEKNEKTREIGISPMLRSRSLTAPPPP